LAISIPVELSVASSRASMTQATLAKIIKLNAT
jgi:DNA-binding XRE family transcriptional regulator